LRKPAACVFRTFATPVAHWFGLCPYSEAAAERKRGETKKDFSVSNLFVIRPYPNAKDGAFPILTRHRLKKNLMRAQSAH